MDELTLDELHQIIIAQQKQIYTLQKQFKIMMVERVTKKAGVVRLGRGGGSVYVELMPIFRDKKMDIPATKALREHYFTLATLNKITVTTTRTNSKGKEFKVYLYKYPFNQTVVNVLMERCLEFEFDGTVYGLHGLGEILGAEHDHG